MARCAFVHRDERRSLVDSAIARPTERRMTKISNSSKSRAPPHAAAAGGASRKIKTKQDDDAAQYVQDT